MVNELTDTSDSFVLLCPKCSQLAQISCEAAPGCSAGFQTCCIADFQIGGACDGARLAGLETHDTADLEVCATSVAAVGRAKIELRFIFLSAITPPPAGAGMRAGPPCPARSCLLPVHPASATFRRLSAL